MGKAKNRDLTGQKFGRWTVLCKAPDRYDKKGCAFHYWLCECDCEKHTIREVKEASLINGNSKSCGCLSKDTMKENREKNEVIPDLIGKRFGSWTVIERAPNVNGSRYWLCKCDCGTIRAIPERHLLNGTSKSCGHPKDLTGMKFGNWTVLYRAEDVIRPNGSRAIMWMCECECGTIRPVSAYALLYGTTKSCGCLRSELISESKKRYNEYDLSGEFGIGYTSNLNQDGFNEFWFDKEDYNLIKDYCWYFSKDQKGLMYLVSKNKEHKEIKFHRLIIPDSEQVDHIKHKTYDNRKSQLRKATNQENTRNQGIQSNNTSGVTGVSQHKNTGLWQAYIGVDGKNIYLCCSKNKSEAEKMRKDAEEKYFGEWSYDNSMKHKE